ncbi:MAG: TonB-dependent receptor [Polymorphobacter sp.]
MRRGAGKDLVAVGALALVMSPALAQAPEQAAAEPGLGEIVVTATRKSETISRVPISISAFGGERLETLNLKSFADVARFTPGVSFNRDRKDIAIRGISSAAGTGTTGIYIDDTPIQVRALGLNANNTLPAVFDLDRVEILRGPQGTLFGAGSEGGTVRYISTQPSLDTFSAMGRIEGSQIEKGSQNYEAGAAIGGPIVKDILGFRLSGWYRRDGGYIDRVDYRTLAVTDGDANKVDTYVVQGALTWVIGDSVTVTPSIFYQNRKQANTNSYWVGISDPDNGVLRSGTPDRQRDDDRFILPALKLEWDAGPVKIISNTSYYDRKQVVGGYSGTLYNLSLFQQLTGDPADPSGSPPINFNGDDNSANQVVPVGTQFLTATGLDLPQLPGYVANVFITNKQRNFVQEVRVQSNDPDSRLQYVVGAFFSSNKQLSSERIFDPQLPVLLPRLFGTDVPGFSLGADMLANGDSYINTTDGTDRQIALFGDATYALTDTLKASIGLRYAWTRFSFVNSADGPQNLGPSDGTGKKSENPFTPKFNISWQATPDALYYATAAKGFRIGGANPPFPQSACQADLDALQITSVPDSYDSDTLWSYEIGTKHKLFDRKLSVSASAYHLKWSNIQQANFLTSCGFQYTDNLGDAQSTGFDIQVQAALGDSLTLDLAAGYTDARYSKTTLTGGAGSPSLVTKGNGIPGVAPWTVALGGQYDFPIGGNDAYLRADYQFASRNGRLTPIQDINNATSDPALVNDPPTHQVSIRAGMDFGQVQVQAFVDNLLNASPQLALSHQDQFTALFEAQTLRPRTFGVWAAFRY